MKKLFYFFVFLCLFGSSTQLSYAQTESDPSDTTTAKVIITMKNGDEFKGVILEQDDERILLQTVNGEIRLIVANIRSIEEDTYTGLFSYSNPHDTRYFFGPAAFPIKKGKTYYQNLLVTTNFFNTGITKGFSLGGGFEFVSTFGGEPVWFFTPKVGAPLSEKVYIGGGLFTAGFAAEGTATLAYGVITLGESESNISASFAYGFADGEPTESVITVVSGAHRTSDNIVLLTENYFLPDLEYFGIHGFRILSKKNAFDIGGVYIPSLDYGLNMMPYVGYVRVLN